jgi:hypothetical protein
LRNENLITRHEHAQTQHTSQGSSLLTLPQPAGVEVEVVDFDYGLPLDDQFKTNTAPVKKKKLCRWMPDKEVVPKEPQVREKCANNAHAHLLIAGGRHESAESDPPSLSLVDGVWFAVLRRPR